VGVLLFSAVLVGLVIVGHGLLIALATTGAFLCFCLVLALRSRAILFVILGYYVISYLAGIGLVGGTIQGFLPSYIGFLADFLLLGYFAWVIVGRLSARQSIIIWLPLDLALLALLLVSILSALMGTGNDIMTTIVGLRTIFEPVVACYLIVNLNPDESLSRTIVKVLYGIGWMQLPIGIAYYVLVANPARDRDMVVGTMSGILAAYVLIVVSSTALASVFLIRRKRLFKIIFVGLSPIFAAIGSAVGAFGLHMLAFLFVCTLFVRRYTLRVFLIIMLLSSLFVTILSYYPVLGYLHGRSDLMGVQGFIKGVSEIYGIQRLDSYGRVFRIESTMKYLLHQGPMTLLLGLGPGSTKIGQRSGVVGSFISANPGAYKPDSLDVTRFLIETGLLSLILVILAVLLVAYAGWRVFQHDNDPYWQAIGVGGLVAALWILLNFPYTSILAVGQSAVFFWSLAGILMVRARRIGIPGLGAAREKRL
jgi:hypothetical protein